MRLVQSSVHVLSGPDGWRNGGVLSGRQGSTVGEIWFLYFYYRPEDGQARVEAARNKVAH